MVNYNSEIFSMTANQCGVCKYFDNHQCKRFPPQPTFWIRDPQSSVPYESIFSHPNVSKDMWCGEFRDANEPVMARISGGGGGGGWSQGGPGGR